KAIRVGAVGVAPYCTVKIALLAGIEVGYGIEGFQGYLETDAVPHLLYNLPTLAVEGDRSETDDLDGSAHRTCLPEQRFGLVRVILQAVALQVPGIATRVGLIEHVALAVKHRVVDGLAVDGVRRGGAQALVLKRPLAKVEDHEDTAEMPRPGGVFIGVALLEALHVGVGDVINQMHLASAQGGQAHRVLLLGFADDLVEIGEVMAFGISLPVVFKAHQFRLVPACPGYKLEGPCANGMFRGGVKRFWRYQVGRVEHDVRRHGHIRHTGIEPDGVLVDDLDGLDVFHHATMPVGADSGVFDAQNVELDGFRIDLAAVVKQYPFAQSEHPGSEVFIGLPALGNARDNIALLVEVGEAGVHRSGRIGGVQLIMPVRIEAGCIEERAKLQYTAPLRMPLRRCPVGREPTQGGTHEHGTGRSEERSAADVGSLCVSVHDGVLRPRRLHALTSLVPRVEQAVPQT